MMSSSRTSALFAWAKTPGDALSGAGTGCGDPSGAEHSCVRLAWAVGVAAALQSQPAAAGSCHTPAPPPLWAHRR